MMQAIAKCSAMSHVGHVRSSNEDAIAVSASGELVRSRWNGALPLQRGWALVADGMGGHAGGEMASRLAIELLRPILASLEDSEQVRLALNAANKALFDTMEHQPELDGMGTTIAGGLLCGDRAFLVNVGDSRIYQHLDGKLTQLSLDHVVDGYLLTQCLGGFSTRARIEPHVHEIALLPGMKLLLCSDGLTDMVSDDAIAALLDEQSPDPAELLVQAALEAGGFDNVSAVVIEVRE